MDPELEDDFDPCDPYDNEYDCWEDDDYEPDVDEAQEWYDFDPDC